MQTKKKENRKVKCDIVIKSGLPPERQSYVLDTVVIVVT